MSNIDPAFWVAVTGVLTGVASAPIYRRSQANRFNWKDELEDGDLPDEWWVVDVGQSEEDNEWALDVVCYRYPLTVFFIRRASLSEAEITANTTVEDAVEVVLAAARDAFIAYSGTAFQLAGRNPTRNISDYNPANDVFYDLEADFFAGAFEVWPLVGV